MFCRALWPFETENVIALPFCGFVRRVGAGRRRQDLGRLSVPGRGPRLVVRRAGARGCVGVGDRLAERACGPAVPEGFTPWKLPVNV